MGLREIARELNEKGVPTTRGGRFSFILKRRMEFFMKAINNLLFPTLRELFENLNLL